MTTALTLLGCGLGCGIVLLARAVTVPSEDLRSAVARYGRLELADIASGRTIGPPEPAGLGRLGARLVAWTGRMPSASARSQDLAATGRSPSQLGVALAWGLLLGGGMPLAAVGVIGLSGGSPPPVLAGVLCLGGAGAGLFTVNLGLRRAAVAARGRFCRALCSWLELVCLAQAGGMGVEGALEAASRVSADPAFASLAAALETARQSGTSPWVALARLGDERGIAEVVEIAASLELAGSEGARIRTSLAAKSASLRRRQLAEAESKANSTTERLFLPSIVLMLGFLVFLMYPAAVSLAHVL